MGIGALLSIAIVFIFALIHFQTTQALTPETGTSTSILATKVLSMGDSISVGFNSDGANQTTNLVNSWTTGSSASVNSLQHRIQAVKGTTVATSVKAHAGDTSANLSTQLGTVGGTGVLANLDNSTGASNLVTLLMGANDLCTSSVSSMTSVSTYQARVASVLNTLGGYSNVKVVVGSIPSLQTLLDIGKSHSEVTAIWQAGNICQNMLANPNSTDSADVTRRATVMARENDFNTALQTECAAHANCSYDGGAVFSAGFTVGELSTIDYFHPNIAGQARIAASVWPAYQAIYPNVSFATAGDTTQPTVAVTSPVAGSVVSGSTVSLSATASDNVGVTSVKFYSGTTYIGDGILSGGSWNYTFSGAANGVYNVTAKAFDAAGNAATSSNVRFTVGSSSDTTAPTVSITAPTAGSTVSGTIVLTATASDNVGVASVKFYSGSTLIGSAALSGSSWVYSYNTVATSNGTYTITAKATDAAGNTTTSSSVTFTVNNSSDTTAPTVSITAPTAGSTVSGTIMLTASASDNIGVTAVKFYSAGTTFIGDATLSGGSWVYSYNTTANSDGTYSLTAKAYDAAGNSTTSSAVSFSVANADTTAPTVAITSPASGATVAGTVTLTATASDNVGVAGVKYYNGTTLIGTATLTSGSWVYAFDTTTTSDGAYSLTAKAYDAAGNVATSNPVSFTVANADTTAPTIPTGLSSSAVGVSSFTASWTASTDAVGVTGYNVYKNGSFVATTATPSYTFTGLLAMTTYNITVSAYDAAGNTSSLSTPLSVTTANAPDTTAPTVPIGLSSSSITTTSFTLNWTASTDAVGVTGYNIYKDGTLLGSTTGLSYTATGLSPSTTYVVTVSAYDAANNTSTQSNGLSVTTSTPPDTTAPTVSVTSPTAGSTVAGTINLAATASDNVGVTAVKFYSGTTLIGNATLSAGVWTYTYNTTTVANGSYPLTAKAYDAAGNVTTSSAISFIVSNGTSDTTAPTVSITAPTTGSTVSGTIALTATASDNVGVTNVKYYYGSTLLGTATLSGGSYVLNYNTNTGSTPNGNYTFIAKAYDAAGNVGTSSSVTLTVNNIPPDTTAPSVSLTSPTNGATVSGTISLNATASDNVGVTSVKYYSGGTTYIGEATLNAGVWSYAYDTTALTNGTYSLTAKAYDAAGNVATSTAASITVYNDTIAPMISITSPTSSAEVSGLVVLESVASDNIAVTNVVYYIDNVSVGSASVTVTGKWSLIYDSSALADGTHTITAKAYDAVGNVTTSTGVAVLVTNDCTGSQPSGSDIWVFKPCTTNIVSGTVAMEASTTATGVAGAKFYSVPVGSSTQFLLGTATYDTTSGHWLYSYDTTQTANGDYTIHVVTYDSNGNVLESSTPITLTVHNIE